MFGSFALTVPALRHDVRIADAATATLKFLTPTCRHMTSMSAKERSKWMADYQMLHLRNSVDWLSTTAKAATGLDMETWNRSWQDYAMATHEYDTQGLRLPPENPTKKQLTA
jgi:hypothetical protein